MALTTGATLVLAHPEQLLPGIEMQRWLQEQAIAVATLPRSVLAALPYIAPPALATIISGGEACSPDIVNTWAPGRRFFNGYGPTETTIWSSVIACLANQPITIGRPIFNTHLYILNEGLQPQPVGIPGELFIGGIGLARGYLNRPDLTAQHFLPHPFSSEPSARLYRTGDLARWLPDGTIDILGRIDHQVKLRGYRIELGEIEAILEQHPTIRQAIVVVAEGTAGEQFLLAYLTCAPENRPAFDELRRYLQGKLPSYMLPARFMVLDALPLLPNGKVDRRALARRELILLEPECSIDESLTPIEERLLKIWSDILGLKHIGIHDNFFDLGGHSLSATRLISRVHSSLHIDIPVRTIFEAPTINSFAYIIEEKQGSRRVNGHTDRAPVVGEDESVQFLLEEHRDIEDDRIANILAKIESLSEEEVLRQLEQRMPQAL